jgi:ATP-dependent DNA helicase PIF1
MSPLHEQQLAALDLVMAGHNVLILGTAGTGKSFLVREIVKQSQEKGIQVALTCTTGIACAVYSNLSKTLRAQTIHQWSGIDDGRFAPSEIKNVLKNNVEYSKTVETIKGTDLLIIDECSMISKKMFNSLAEVCSIKNENMNFGGIQLVLVGDFHQLPPVPNLLCNDDGDFCFNSKIFDSVITHRVTMTSVMRQTEDILIKAVQEVSLGKLSDETKVFIETLKRPLPDGEANIKLFSTNDRVDDFNRDRILDFPGPLYEFVASDSGDKKYLSHILAPHILWLKKGAPVILLRNLSDKLFNGLRGEVYDIVDGGAIIEFPSVGLKIPVQKMKFSGKFYTSLQESESLPFWIHATKFSSNYNAGQQTQIQVPKANSNIFETCR